MPLMIIRVLISVLFIFSTTYTLLAQLPTSVDVMRERISKAKAHLVVKNYSAAIYELENIRRETGDRTIHRVVNVLLMHSYLEQGDYKRTRQFLKELYKSKKPNAASDYLAVAGQVVSGAKTQLKRYQALGLSISDEKLPAFASADINEMRKTLEMVVGHSKVLGKNKKLATNSLALLEETANARASFARDAYDAKRWENEVSDTRAQLASSGSNVINALDDAPINSPDVTLVDASAVVEMTDSSEADESKKKPSPPEETAKEVLEPAKKEASDNKILAREENKPPLKTKEKASPLKRPVRIITSAKRDSTPPRVGRDEESNESTKTRSKSENDKNSSRKRIKNNVATDTNRIEDEDTSPLEIGSLIGYATKRVTPTYPRQARTMRMTGVVKVELVVDEEGRVTKIEKTSGPALLKRAATDAAIKWRFRPFKRGGQPVKATGFVSFNFRL